MYSYLTRILWLRFNVPDFGIVVFYNNYEHKSDKGIAMKKRTIKDIIYFLIIFLTIFVSCVILFDVYMETSFKDLNIPGDTFEQKYRYYSHMSDCFEDRNYCDKYEQDCKERNGIWQEDKRYCKLD